MNALYRAIRRQIADAMLAELVEKIEENPENIIPETVSDPRWKKVAAKRKRFMFELAQAVREGWKTHQLREGFSEDLIRMETGTIRRQFRAGKVTQGGLWKLYDEYRSLPGLRELSERDFFLFVAHVAARP